MLAERAAYVHVCSASHVIFQLEAVVETLPERLMGLTEMVPERAWQVAARLRSVSYWLVLRSAWVLGSSAALLLLPSFVELQRVELEEMQSAQKKQVCQCTPTLRL